MNCQIIIWFYNELPFFIIWFYYELPSFFGCSSKEGVLSVSDANLRMVRLEFSHTATHGNTRQHTATHCNTLQHTATHCNTLQHTATHCNTLQHTATNCNTLQHTATHCNTLQHTATNCNTLQHIAVPVTHRGNKNSHITINEATFEYTYTSLPTLQSKMKLWGGYDE